MAWIFGRPEYDISFHVNTDSADLIGTDTFINNEVRLRKGSIYQCAEFGGFGILDEINMAKNDAVSVLHATLDHRRRIDIPGYNRILLHPATRFIGTMNYGYAGTRELNEALVSVMTGNNEIGTIEPLDAVASMLRGTGTLFLQIFGNVQGGWGGSVSVGIYN